ncbi:MAG: OB-fold domain-containing protein [SAR324 cluster bacterium]|nr:OB-fold domain-containing protein [SAR324 cluster bacterium]
MVGITSFGGYIPRLRLLRKSIVDAHSWADPSLRGKAKFERSMCNWDEDSVTMGVEAARDCIAPISLKSPDAIYFASTSMPFVDRQNAGIIVEALSLGQDIASLDIGSSQRAGTSALMQALAAVKGGSYQNALVVASDHRKTRPSSTQELAFGDGAAAVTIGTEHVILEYLGGHSTTVDFVDHFKGEGQQFDYNWEERWIRDEGYKKIIPPTIAQALAKTNLPAEAINHFVLPATIGRAAETAAKAAGISSEILCDNLAQTCGDTGVAHPLIMLLNRMEEDVRAGQLIMVASFGQGCDVLIFRVTEHLAKMSKPNGIRGSLANRQEESNYNRFLAFNRLIDKEYGMRAERDNKTALTTLYRRRDMILGLVGGKCRQCGSPQFPRQDVCVNPDCAAPHTQDPYSFVNENAKIQSWSADYLTYTMDPPSHYGMIVFDKGGRFMTDFTDVAVGEIDVGTAVRMVFRIKGFDERRGFVRYFWKAVPIR